ncbi:MAG: ribosome-associated translation inhibitor RaiA [Minisyncoccia bacterium]
MNIKLRAKNFDITPAIDDYVTKKISTLEKFLGSKDNILCEVEIGRTTIHHKQGDIFRAEVNIIEPGDKQIFAVAEEVDIYTAIDVVRDEAEREIVSKKTKQDTLFRRGATRLKNLLKRINYRNK